MNDIETIKEKLKIIESLCTDDCISKPNVIEPLKYAIENLINRVKDLEEKDDLVKYCRGPLPKDTIAIMMCNDDFCRNFGNDFIPKSKIKEKIKELSDEMLEAENIDTFYQKGYARQVLQDLLK